MIALFVLLTPVCSASGKEDGNHLVGRIQKLRPAVTSGAGYGVISRRLDRLEGRINRLTAESSSDGIRDLTRNIPQAEILVEAWRRFNDGDIHVAEAICMEMRKDDADDPDVAELLGLIAMTKKDWVGAEGQIKRSLNIRVGGRPTENPDVAVSMTHLGHIRRQAGDIDGAHGFFARAMDIFDSSVGPNDTEALLALEPMSRMYTSLWRGTGTDPTPENLRSHQTSAEKMLWLADRFKQRRDFTRAETLLKILLLEKRPAVPSTPTVDAQVAADLLNLHIDMDARTKVYDHIYSVYPVPDTLPAESQIRVAHVLQRYLGWAPFQDTAGDWRKIGAILTHIHRIYQRIDMPEDHPDRIMLYRKQAHTYRGLKRYAESETMYRQFITSLMNTRRPGHPDIIEALWMFARMYAEAGRFDEAEHYFRESIDMNVAMLGPKDPRLYSKLRDWGDVRAIRGNFAQAEALIRKALTICEESQGAHTQTAALTKRLGQICEKQKKHDEAKMLYARAAAILGTDPAQQADTDNSNWKEVEENE